MPSIRKTSSPANSLLEHLSKDERWLIVINADPDALASAMALKRIFCRRTAMNGIAYVNEITRPDNLAMMRYLRIPAYKLTPNVAAQFDRFAMVDSQPHHHPGFADLKFSIVIDHHPPHPVHPVSAPFTDIRNDYGSTSTILTEYMQHLQIRPGKLLATALLYGIKTDTQSFERYFSEVDFKAYRYLTRWGNHLLLRKIARSEFHLDWLKYFYRAFRSIRLFGQGLVVFMCRVDAADILVILADFFLRVREVSWVSVCGISRDNMVVVFRGDGIRRDMGKLAAKLFGDLGSAGGHKTAARAEIPLSRLNGDDPETFLINRIEERGEGNGNSGRRRRKTKEKLNCKTCELCKFE